jgi:hypothetical protein
LLSSATSANIIGMTAPKPQVVPDMSKLAQQVKKAKSRVRVEDLVEDLTAEFGGTKAVAQLFVKEFKDSKIGSIGRSKLLDAYVRLVSLISKKEVAVDASDMTDDEIQSSMGKLIEKFLTSTPIVAAPPIVTEESHGETPPIPSP